MAERTRHADQRARIGAAATYQSDASDSTHGGSVSATSRLDPGTWEPAGRSARLMPLGVEILRMGWHPVERNEHAPSSGLKDARVRTR